jgi:hypothetical protein
MIILFMKILPPPSFAWFLDIPPDGLAAGVAALRSFSGKAKLDHEACVRQIVADVIKATGAGRKRDRKLGRSQATLLEFMKRNEGKWGGADPVFCSRQAHEGVLRALAGRGLIREGLEKDRPKDPFCKPTKVWRLTEEGQKIELT